MKTLCDTCEKKKECDVLKFISVIACPRYKKTDKKEEETK